MSQPSLDDFFDFAQMDEVMGDDSPELIDILRSFFEDMEERLIRLPRLLAEGNLPELTSEAHQIKGMSSSFGFKSVAAYAGAIEQSARANQPAHLPTLLDGLRDSQRYCVATLRTLRPHYFS